MPTTSWCFARISKPTAKLVAGASHKRLVNDFADTPIVSIAGDRPQCLGAVGLAYTF